MKVTFLVLYFAGVLQASFATQNLNIVTEIIPVNDFEIAGNRFRSRRDYADIENSVGDFLDDVDFFLGKFEIIRNILKDVRYTYFILKQDILLIQDDIQVTYLCFIIARIFQEFARENKCDRCYKDNGHVYQIH